MHNLLYPGIVVAAVMSLSNYLPSTISSCRLFMFVYVAWADFGTVNFRSLLIVFDGFQIVYLF